MARNLFQVEKGVAICNENAPGGVHKLTGSGAPPGTTGVSDAAPIGSTWSDQAAGGVQYIKIASTSSASDWLRLTNETVYTALGLAYGATDMGVYPGAIISNNVDQTTVNAELEAAIEAIAPPIIGETTAPAGTPTVINSSSVDNACATEWEVCVFETGDETKKEYFKIAAIHNGTSTTDATVGTNGTDDTIFSKLSFPGNKIAGLNVQTLVNGTGVGQTVDLEMSATAAITVKFRRNDVV